MPQRVNREIHVESQVFRHAICGIRRENRRDTDGNDRPFKQSGDALGQVPKRVVVAKLHHQSFNDLDDKCCHDRLGGLGPCHHDPSNQKQPTGGRDRTPNDATNYAGDGVLLVRLDTRLPRFNDLSVTPLLGRLIVGRSTRPYGRLYLVRPIQEERQLRGSEGRNNWVASSRPIF